MAEDRGRRPRRTSLRNVERRAHAPESTNGTAVVEQPTSAVTRRDEVRQLVNASPSLTGVSVSPRRTADAIGVFFGSTPVIVPPPDYESQWQVMNLDANTFARLSPQALVSRLIELSPDISRALWDYLRLFNPGWTLTVFNVGTDTQNVKAQAYCEQLIARLTEMYGTVDVTHGRMAMSMFMRGALFTELVLDENGRDFADFIVVDPISVRFRRVQDPRRGQRFELGQMQIGGYVALDDYLTVSYIPVDPSPDSPYGRPMVSPAIFASLFLLGLLHDLRRVISQQGYPRIDLKVNLERLAAEAKQSMPQILGNPQKYKEWVAGIFDGIKTVYAGLEPDAAYIHSDSVEVGRPVGTADPSSLGAIPSIIEIIERWLVRALKTMPLLMATRQSNTETQANREWEIHAAGIKSIQHYAEVMWERQFSLALRAQGMQAEVQFRYAELRAAELMRDQQAMQLLIENEFKKMAYGWQDNDASALAVTGHPALDAFPIILPKGYAEVGAGAVSDAPDATENPDPGASRQLDWRYTRDMSDVVRNFRKRAYGVEWEPIRTLTHRGPKIMWRVVGERVLREKPAKIEVHGDVLPVDDVEVDRRSLRRAVRRFDDSVADWAGILDAKVV